MKEKRFIAFTTRWIRFALNLVLSLALKSHCFFRLYDGSCDDTLDILKTLSEHDGAIQFSELLPEFGKEAAILAGLSHASGDFVAVMDVDLQDPPELLSENVYFWELSQKDMIVLAARRVSRKESFPFALFAWRYYHLLNRMSKMTIVDGARDYWFMTRDVVEGGFVR